MKMEHFKTKLSKVNLPKIDILHVLSLEKAQKSTIYLVALGIFVALNLVVNLLPARIDLSSEKAYTLSPSTKKVIAKIDDVVNIKVFISSDLPLRLLPLKTDILDLVGEYKKAGRGKITFTIMDPKKDKSAREEAGRLEIPELQLSQIERDKYAVSAAYLGIAVLFEDKREIIPQATNLSSLEYDLTSSIYKMTRKEIPKVALIGTQDVPDVRMDQYFTVKQVLRKQFEIELINIATESGEMTIDSSVKTVLLFDNGTTRFSREQTDVLKDYINNGGHVIFMVDGVYVQNGLATQDATHGLFDFFRSFGVTLNRDFVLSETSELANFSTGTVSFFTPYPFWVKTANFTDNSAMFSNIDVLIFPWASSVDVSKKKGNNVLVKSERNSWTQTEPFVLDPTNVPGPGGKPKELKLIVEVKNKKDGGFILIPTSRFVREQFLSRNAYNLEFVINAVSNFAAKGALSGIRARTLAISPLKDVPEQSKDVMKFLAVLLLPSALALFGGYRLFKRRR